MGTHYVLITCVTVEPISSTPTWVHFDERTTVAGYPVIRYGSKGNYVCVAQDALNALGYTTGGLDRNIWNEYKKCSFDLPK